HLLPPHIAGDWPSWLLPVTCCRWTAESPYQSLPLFYSSPWPGNWQRAVPRCFSHFLLFDWQIVSAWLGVFGSLSFPSSWVLLFFAALPINLFVILVIGYAQVE